MSLTADGIWKAGVWAPTVWADDVWYEGEGPSPAPAPSPVSSGGYNRKRQWSVRTGLGEVYFDTREEALEFYENPEGKKKKSKKIKSLGKVISYGGIDVSTVEVENRSGSEIILQNDARMLGILERLIEQQLINYEIEKAEEEEILMLMAAII